MNIWKIASRWSENGDPNSSIIDIFRNNNIAFAGRETERILNSIKPDDIIAISDGITIVSVGKVTSKPKPITEFSINELDIKSERFAYEDWVIGFKINLYDLKENERFDYRQGTFHGVNEPNKSGIKELFNKYNKEYAINSKFSINATTCTLKNNSQNNGDTILNGNKHYIIPIYQRPYSWTEEQIKKFISDIFRSFYGYDKKTPSEPMFIGTMQLSEKKFITANKSSQNIIDGQQRLTTFLVLLKLLKIQFPENKELKNISLQWLETRVNNGEQNKYLQEFISSDNIEISNNAINKNKYIQNASIIKEILDEELKDDKNEDVDFDLDSFLKHLLSNIYFVIIETKAGLSKTLQIFDAINTTGLDLNGGDIFKIRMYEYLTDKKKYGEKAFKEISNLYAEIDRQNNEYNLHINITEILDIYKYVLIAKNNLPTVLYTYGTDTFFNRLFDTIFNINEWTNFGNTKNIDLSLSDISQIIKIRYYWEKMEYQTTEDACSMNFIWWSRYGRYAILIFVFMYHFKNEDNFEQKIFTFIKQLSKVFIIYSIRFQKSINEIHRFIYSLLQTIDKKSYLEVINEINQKIEDNKQHALSHLSWYLTENLTQNRKRKDIVCRLSGMLEEDYENSKDINEIADKLFDWQNFPIDIEHIQSLNDENIEEREEIWKKWGDNINSIGNLMILERDKNRSISNKPYKSKIKEYKNSKYKIVKKQVDTYSEWSLEQSLERKEKELKKMLKYLFNE